MIIIIINAVPTIFNTTPLTPISGMVETFTPDMEFKLLPQNTFFV